MPFEHATIPTMTWRLTTFLTVVPEDSIRGDPFVFRTPKENGILRRVSVSSIHRKQTLFLPQKVGFLTRIRKKILERPSWKRQQL